MIGRLTTFAAASALLWLLIALPARAFWGDDTVLTSAVALAVCLVPGLGTLAWVQWSWRKPVETQFVAAMGGTGVRLAVAVVVTIALGEAVPFLAANGLVAWVILFYLITLGLEMGLLLAAWPRANPVNSPAPAAGAPAAGAAPRAE